MTRRYPVRPRTRTLILAALFFAACSLVTLWWAITDKRGLVLWDSIHLSPSAARILWSVICGVSAAFVLGAIAGIVIYSKHTPEVVVDDAGITTPGPLWRLRATRTVLFADVIAIQEQRISGQHFVTLAPRRGRKVWISRSYLPAGAFEEILAFAKQRVAATR